jgi:hypothetical protein
MRHQNFSPAALRFGFAQPLGPDANGMHAAPATEWQQCEHAVIVLGFLTHLVYPADADSRVSRFLWLYSFVSS